MEVTYNKHIGVYSSEEEFNEKQGELSQPWVAYVGNPVTVRYSNEMTLGNNALTIAADLSQRLSVLENSVVTLTESEYDTLITNGEADITPLGGEAKHVAYDANVFYYTYNPEDLPEEE